MFHLSSKRHLHFWWIVVDLRYLFHLSAPGPSNDRSLNNFLASHDEKQPVWTVAGSLLDEHLQDSGMRSFTEHHQPSRQQIRTFPLWNLSHTFRPEAAVFRRKHADSLYLKLRAVFTEAQQYSSFCQKCWSVLMTASSTHTTDVSSVFVPDDKILYIGLIS